ncbi:hypothetical protein GJAV_G00265310 [Gymnothorax javanicus]|nr:hypothetical protein GJAV_G00265310 [Gymnothorax javanicus]
MRHAEMAKELKPRLCVMAKGESGYGFHLHGEKGKSGQFIRKVEPASPAEAAGLRAGDRVVEVNSVNVERETHHQVVQRIKAVESETRLLVVDVETDTYLRSLRLTCTEEMAISTPAKPSHKQNGSVSKDSDSLSSVETTKSSKRTLSQNSKQTSQGGYLHVALTGPPRHGTGEGLRPADKQAHTYSHTGHLSSADSPGNLCTCGNTMRTDLVLQESPAPGMELRPRLCHLLKAEMGFGFNLHSEKSRPGQYIRSIDPDSPAEGAGLKSKDRVIEVNGVNIENLRHSEVVAFIRGSGKETRLLVVDPETDEHFKRLGVTPTERHAKDFISQPMTNGSPKSQTNGKPGLHSPQISGPVTRIPDTSSKISPVEEMLHRTSSSSGQSSGTMDTNKQVPVVDGKQWRETAEEASLKLSSTAAEAKEKALSKRTKKRAPPMDWSKKYELFSNF